MSGTTFVKICGITGIRDARSAARAGANAIGLVFASSPRRVSVARARQITGQVHPSVTKIGVFVDASEQKILQAVDEAGLDGVQLQGAEPAELAGRLKQARPSLWVCKVVRFAANGSRGSAADAAPAIGADVVMFDRKDVSRPEAASEPIPSEWLRAVGAERYIVAGGLTAANIGPLVAEINPWGVDVSGGVELRPGKKDPQKMQDFVAAVRAAEKQSGP